MRDNGNMVAAWRRPLWPGAAFALAMALVEAAIVIHLRGLYYPQDRLAIFPLRMLSPADLRLEWAREAATVVMLLAVALLIERGPARVFAAFLYLFGLWDLGYYLWLKVFLGWPVSWSEWDVLFLIPWPWLGPWLAPAAIALLFVLWGGAVLASAREPRFTRLTAALFLNGALLALAAFLEPGWGLLAHGPEAFEGYVPGRLRWELFGAGYALMAAGLCGALRPGGRRKRPRARRAQRRSASSPNGRGKATP